MIDDATLLQRYATEHSEAAFAELVRRHLPLVYAAACRRLGGQTHRAADVSQSVFIALARNARQLSRHPVLTGWLYTSTRYAALDAIRAERRRHAREQEASAMEEICRPESALADWEQLRPFIDQAVDELDNRDREALLLRFFQNRPFAEIGSLLGLSEDASRKRVDRALDRLRSSLGRRGLTSTSVVLASVIAAGSAATVPAGLATSITGASTATAGASAVGAFSFLSSAAVAWSVAAVSLTVGAIGFVSQRTNPGATETAATATPVVTARPSLATNSESSPPTAMPINATPSATAAPTTVSAAPPAPPPRASASPAEVAKLRQRYDPFLIGQRGLTSEQAARFVELKLAIAEVQADLQASMESAQAQGGTAGIEALRSRLTRPMWDEIRTLLGPEGNALYSDYEQTSAYRPTVTNLFRTAGVPLTDAQTDPLVRLVIKHNQPIRARPTDLGLRSQIDWSAVTRDAADLLTPAQLTILRVHAERTGSR